MKKDPGPGIFLSFTAFNKEEFDLIVLRAFIENHSLRNSNALGSYSLRFMFMLCWLQCNGWLGRMGILFECSSSPPQYSIIGYLFAIYFGILRSVWISSISFSHPNQCAVEWHTCCICRIKSMIAIISHLVRQLIMCHFSSYLYLLSCHWRVCRVFTRFNLKMKNKFNKKEWKKNYYSINRKSIA